MIRCVLNRSMQKMMALLPVTTLLLIGAGMTTPTFADEGTDDVRFAMPSKNIWCIYRPNLQATFQGAVFCDVINHAWSNWAQGENWGSLGQRFMLPQAGPAVAVRSSDSLEGTSETVLEYGKKIILGSVTCQSESTGLTCTNKSGGLLHLNREFYLLNQPVTK